MFDILTTSCPYCGPIVATKAMASRKQKPLKGHEVLQMLHAGALPQLISPPALCLAATASLKERKHGGPLHRLNAALSLLHPLSLELRDRKKHMNCKSPGPSGPESRKSLQRVFPAPGPKKCPKQSPESQNSLFRDSGEETLSRLFRTLFGPRGRKAPGDSFGIPSPEGPGDSCKGRAGLQHINFFNITFWAPPKPPHLGPPVKKNCDSFSWERT